MSAAGNRQKLRASIIKMMNLMMMMMILIRASTEFPSMAAIIAKDECSHRFIGGTRLKLVVGAITLPATTALNANKINQSINCSP